MKRFYTLIALFSLLFTMISPAIHSAAAGSNDDEDKKYADGEYDLPFVILKDTNDDESMTNSYMQSPAKVTIEDGKQTVQLTLTSSTWWQYLKTQTTQPGTFDEDNFADATLISEDAENNTHVVEFDIQDLDEVLNAKIHIKIIDDPLMPPGFVYDNHYDIRFDFDSSDLPIEEESDEEGAEEEPEEESGDEGTEEDPDSPEEQKVIDIEDGNYTIGFEALHAEEDKTSGMARYIDPIADISVKKGKTHLTITLIDHTTVTGFQVESAGELIEPVEENVDEKENTRSATYELSEFVETMNARVQYTSGAHNGDQPLRLAFDKGSLQEKIVEEPEDPEKELEDPERDPVEDPANDPFVPDVTYKYKDGEYDLPFIIWQADKDEVSVADAYLEHPAKLIVEDGKYTVQTTLKNSSWWQYFKVELNGSFVDVTEVSRNASTDTSVVQFEVEDIDAILDAKVHIIVTGIPGFDYDNKYDIRFTFDTSSIPVNEGYTPGEPIEKPDEDLEQVDPNDTDDGEIPSFNRNDNGDTNREGSDKGSGDGHNNPQTGDTAKIMRFALLLIGSLIPIVIQIRKRFVAS